MQHQKGNSTQAAAKSGPSVDSYIPVSMCFLFSSGNKMVIGTLDFVFHKTLF